MLLLILVLAIAISYCFYMCSRHKKYIGCGDIPIVSLEYEYRRYTYISRILSVISALGSKYETRNIVERWLLSMVNFAQDKFDQIFATDVLDKSCRFNQQMIHELKEKTQSTANDISAAIDNVIDIVKEYKDVYKQPCKDSKFTIRAGMFRYKEYTRKISPSRMSLLISRASKYKVAVMLMRYACILPGAQHWNMPRDNYKLYYDRGIRIEGFASPVNAQLIAIDPSCQFCSLFPDVDAVFGSIGNFFDTSFVGKKVAVGPPYTVELFARIATKLNKECELAAAKNADTLFYVTFSAWRDTEGYQQLRDSKYCHFAAILPGKQHYYINTNDPAEPKVVATFDTVFFALQSPIKNNVVDYSNIFSAMSLKDFKLVPITAKKV